MSQEDRKPGVGENVIGSAPGQRLSKRALRVGPHHKKVRAECRRLVKHYVTQETALEFSLNQCRFNTVPNQGLYELLRRRAVAMPIRDSQDPYFPSASKVKSSDGRGTCRECAAAPGDQNRFPNGRGFAFRRRKNRPPGVEEDCSQCFAQAVVWIVPRLADHDQIE